GLDYLVDLGRVDSLMPVVAPGGKPILLSNSANFDQNTTLENVTAELDNAARRAQVLGGYAYVGVDVAGYQPDSPLEAGVRRYLEETKGKPVWNAGADDVARWWKAHEGITMTSAWNAASSTLTLDVV